MASAGETRRSESVLTHELNDLVVEVGRRRTHHVPVLSPPGSAGGLGTEGAPEPERVRQHILNSVVVPSVPQHFVKPPDQHTYLIVGHIESSRPRFRIDSVPAAGDQGPRGSSG